jgi:hypothetical protein
MMMMMMMMMMMAFGHSLGEQKQRQSRNIRSAKPCILHPIDARHFFNVRPNTSSLSSTLQLA